MQRCRLFPSSLSSSDFGDRRNSLKGFCLSLQFTTEEMTKTHEQTTDYTSPCLQHSKQKPKESQLGIQMPFASMPERWTGARPSAGLQTPSPKVIRSGQGSQYGELKLWHCLVLKQQQQERNKVLVVGWLIFSFCFFHLNKIPAPGLLEFLPSYY